MTLHREALQRVGWNLLGYVAAGALVLALPIVIIKSMGRTAYGLYNYVVILLSQAYLLNFGLGEALAFYLSKAPFEEEKARYWARHALGGMLLSSGLGAILWLIGGPESLISLLEVSPAWQPTLLQLRGPGALAIVGYAVAGGLGWIPLATGRKRALLLLPLGQAFTQGLLPLLVVFARPNNLALLFQTTLLSMGGLGLVVWIVVSRLLGGWLWPTFSGEALKALWTKGLWQGLSQWSGLFLSYYERTLIGRYVSLGQMGIYSAGHYVFAKAHQFLYKSAEALLPSYGETKSFFRARLRLYQTMWLIGAGAGASILFLGGVAGVLLPKLVSSWGLAEARLTSGVLGTLGLMSWLVPLAPFMISQGQLRRYYFISLGVAVFQVLLTLPCLRFRLYLWPSALASLLLMSLLRYLLPAERGSAPLWRYWVFWPFMRLGLAWLVASVPSLFGFWEPIFHLVSGAISLAVFLVGEFWRGRRKHTFLRQLIAQG